MFVSLFLSLCTPLVLGVVWIAELNQHELNWQKTQILLDNTAILLGRSDREMVRRLEQDKIGLSALHKKLHGMRACSLIPATALQCRKFAKILQLAIRKMTVEAMIRAQRAWTSGTALAQSELRKANYRFLLRRAPGVKVQSTHCSICFEVSGWNLNSLNQIKSRLLDLTERKISTSVSIMKEPTGDWTYRLWSQ